MIQEEYVKFETAKLLIEKGFPSGHPEVCTQSLVMRWLREEKHYYIQIMLDSWALGGHSGYYIVIQDINSDFEEISPAVNDNDDVFFKTYEEAAEAAIKYVLEKLV